MTEASVLTERRTKINRFRLPLEMSQERAGMRAILATCIFSWVTRREGRYNEEKNKHARKKKREKERERGMTEE